MAINIYSEPNSMASPYRPLFMDVSSDEGTISRMIGDVYVNGTLQATIEKQPILGTNDTFRFEIGDVLKKYLFSEFNETFSPPEVLDNTTSALSYYVRAFEVLDNGTTLDTSWSEAGAGTNYQQSTTLYSFNGVNQHEDTMSNYIANGSTKKFLTNRPQNSKILNNQDFYLGALIETSGFSTLFYQTEYNGKNGTGSSLGTSSAAITSVTYGKATYAVDPSGFNANTQSVVFTANSGIDDSLLTEEFTVNIHETCGDETVIYWQNHWGEFDTYFFEGRKRERTKTKTKSIEDRS